MGWCSQQPDIAMLRSKQIQDPDNWVSDPTDLVVKPDFNRFRIMLGIVPKCYCVSASRSEDSATHKPKILRCSPGGTTIDLCIAMGTGRDLEHAVWFISPLLTPHFNLAWETRPIYAGCSALLRFLLVSWVQRFAYCTLRRAPTAWRLVFLKYKMLHKTLKPRDTSEGFINARLGSVFRQDYIAWVDRAGCGQEQKLELCHLTTKF